METKKGYIIPIILIALLIILAGVFVFAQKQAESPVIETPIETPVRQENIIEEPKEETEINEEKPDLSEEEDVTEDVFIETNNSIILE